MTVDSCRRKYPFVYSARVKWGEMDALGHLNNTVYFRFSEEARIHLFDDLQIPVNSLQTSGPILAYIDCQFFSPVTFPDTLIVGSWIEHIGRTSIQIMHHYYSMTQS
ncbi:MAG: acyl-CoA thioesterase, partial [Saprospiraceae bacterium]|nr:acyl-CoA thioesterase [Saprospiraceae bacterium]